MNRDQKAAVIDELAAQITAAEAVIAVDYRGLSVTQAVELRQRLGESGATFRVVKNRLTERAADQAGATALKELLDGPTALTFVRDDAALTAKALATFGRANQLLAFKGGLMDGDALSAEDVASISRLPSRDVLQGHFLGVLASPLTGLARGLSSLISGLAIQLRQVEEKGLVGGRVPGALSEGATGDEPEVPEAPDEAPPAGPPEGEPAPEGPPEPAPPEAPGDPVAEAEAAEAEASEAKAEASEAKAEASEAAEESPPADEQGGDAPGGAPAETEKES